MERQLQNQSFDEADTSVAVGLTFLNPSSELCDSDAFFTKNQYKDLPLRRIQSTNSNNNAQTSRLDNTTTTIASLKSSDLKKLSRMRTSVQSSHLSPRSSELVTQSNIGDYTEIMGYKNINISADVDQSYMLKGGGNTSRQSQQVGYS